MASVALCSDCSEVGADGIGADPGHLSLVAYFLTYKMDSFEL